MGIFEHSTRGTKGLFLCKVHTGRVTAMNGSIASPVQLSQSCPVKLVVLPFSGRASKWTRPTDDRRAGIHSSCFF